MMMRTGILKSIKVRSAPPKPVSNFLLHEVLISDRRTKENKIK